ADLTAAGLDTEALLGSLSGTAALRLVEGAVKGIDLDQVIRQVRDALGGRLPVERGARAGERTPFSSMNARFRIENGVARSDEVDLRADWMRAQATGQIDLRARTLDWRVRATITDTPGGDPDPARRDAFDRLRGLTVPISLTGTYDDLRYRVDVEALAGGVLRREAERRLGERLGLTPEPGGASAPREQPKPIELLRDLLKR
ncbi:MAG: AsmA family protein, partial [Limnobacter sp.]|nr:AsmA family protein [Limnobacter sp.]